MERIFQDFKQSVLAISENMLKMFAKTQKTFNGSPPAM